MKLFFEPTIFYVEAHESALPNQSDLVAYFLNDFSPYYQKLSNRINLAFKIKDQNAKIFYGGKGKIKNTPDTLNYQNIHAEHLKLNHYYGLLLTAAKRKYGIWLNDLLPTSKKKK